MTALGLFTINLCITVWFAGRFVASASLLFRSGLPGYTAFEAFEHNNQPLKKVFNKWGKVG